MASEAEAGASDAGDRKADRKANKKAVKEQRRLQRAGLADPSLGRKPCTICHRPSDLLVRCQVDASSRWHMACGKCWAQASGGKVDGTPSTPHYRYGGLWKNHHAGKSGKHRVPKSASSPGHGSRPQQQDKLQEQEQLRELQEGGNEQESEGHVERDEEQVGGLEEMLLAAAAACPDADNSSTTPT